MTNRNDGRTRISRRRAIAAGAGVLTAGLAGCASTGDEGADEAVSSSGDDENGSDDGTDETANDSTDDSEEVTVVASFFSFYDFARTVADGTAITVENLVPTGLHGHGWEPDASVTQDIIEADAFIHVGENFQPWADRAIQTLEDDDVDTQLINAREGVELVPLAETLDPEEEGVGDGRGLDPHFWLDPQRAKQSVDNIAAGLAELSPDDEEALMDAAETYNADVLERIDQDYQAIFDAAERDVVQLAAHNAFQYVTERYGVQMRPLVTNLAASNDIPPSAITEAQEVIAENDIRYIGAGVFETRRPAEQLIAETDVEAYYPVTPYAGAREDWVENDWGYEEIADNINMPTFEVALGNTEPEDVGPDGWDEEWRNFE